MARKPKQKPQAEPAKNFEEVGGFESDAVEEDVGNIEAAASSPAVKVRDWRDVEKYKELRSLRRLVDDDLDLDDEPPARKPGT